MIMLREFVQYIQDIARPVMVKDDQEREYSTIKLNPILNPVPAVLTIHTLTGICDYLHHNRDGLKLEELILQVLDPYTVELFSELSGEFLQREQYLRAAYQDPTRNFFGVWHDVETFVIAMQSLFDGTDDKERILQYVAGLNEDSSRNLKDDGIVQRTTIRQGLSAIVSEKPLENPVMLNPYRTFPEIDQPPSMFVFRLRKGKNSEGLPECALLEADGGQWQLTAIEKIKWWLLKEGMKESISMQIAIIA